MVINRNMAFGKGVGLRKSVVCVLDVLGKGRE